MGGSGMVNSIKITDYITEELIDLDLKSKNRDEKAGVYYFYFNKPICSR